MTVNEAIAKANMLRMNTMPDEEKAELLRRLDGELTEMFDADWKPPEEPAEEELAEEPEPVPEWPKDNVWPEIDAELLLPFPYDGVYVDYLCAQIDLHNMETDLYQNDMAVYNTTMGEARAWWRRNHLPRRNHNWKVMPMLPYQVWKRR